MRALLVSIYDESSLRISCGVLLAQRLQLSSQQAEDSVDRIDPTLQAALPLLRCLRAAGLQS